MSATLDESLFSSYFNNCPVINISGRTFPVEIHYQEDVDLIVSKLWPTHRLSDTRAHEIAETRSMSGPGVCDIRLIAQLVVGIITQFSCADGGHSASARNRGEGILVFLPGMQTMSKVEHEIKSLVRNMKLPIAEELQVVSKLVAHHRSIINIVLNI